jgi:PKD repeat protein
VGQPCQFTDGSGDSDGTIQSRSWTFQDGTPSASNETNPSVTFASEGPKTVSLTVTDDDGATDTETKTVNVSPPANAAPDAVNDSYSTFVDVPINEGAGSLTANDSPPETGDIYSTSLESSPTNGGQVTVESDGSFIYTPPPGYNGPDSFEYRLNDGRGGTDVATVSIQVAP